MKYNAKTIAFRFSMSLSIFGLIFLIRGLANYRYREQALVGFLMIMGSWLFYWIFKGYFKDNSVKDNGQNIPREGTKEGGKSMSGYGKVFLYIVIGVVMIILFIVLVDLL